MEIPSLIMLSLSSWGQQLSREDRLKLRERLEGMFDKHHYSDIFRVFDQMDWCLHCDNQVSQFMTAMRSTSSQEPYHLVVAHPDLRYKKNCDCQVCNEENQSHVYNQIDSPVGKARVILCVRCKQSYHLADTGFYGVQCSIVPFMSTSGPFYLRGDRPSSRYHDHIFTLTHRTPSYIVEWTQSTAIKKHVTPLENVSIHGGHALCDTCTSEMLFVGQLRWHDQRPQENHSFYGGFCEGCSQGSLGNIHTIVIKKSDNIWRFGSNHVIDFQQDDWALYRYGRYGNTYVCTIYVPTGLSDSMTKYLHHGSLICDPCFKDIVADLKIVWVRQNPIF